MNSPAPLPRIIYVIIISFGKSIVKNTAIANRYRIYNEISIAV